MKMEKTYTIRLWFELACKCAVHLEFICIPKCN